MSKKIKQIIIDSFRGYKDRTIFDLTKNNSTTPADLIVIHAPNGFGKTSFFEGVEWCLSNKLSRIEKNRILGESEDKDRGYTLKNKDSKKLYGEVSIISDDTKELTRITSKSKNTSLGFRDYGYSEITKNELPSFTKIDHTSHILTQDGMDSFLRFTSSEEKFKALENFWENGILISEKYRELFKLLAKISNRIEKLNLQIEKLKYQLEAVQISPEQITRANSSLEEINSNLEDSKKIKFTFTKDVKSKDILDASTKLKTLLIEIDSSLKNIDTKKNKINHVKNKLPEYMQNKILLSKISKQIEKNKSIIDKFKQRELLEQELKQLDIEVQNYSIFKEKVSKINSLYKSHKEIENTLILSRNKINISNENIQNLTKNRQKVEAELTEQNLLLNSLLLEMNSIDTKQNIIESILSIIKNYEDEKNRLNNLQTTYATEYQTMTNEFVSLKKQKNEYDIFKLFQDMFNNEEFNIGDKYLSDYELIKALYLKYRKNNDELIQIEQRKKKTMNLKSNITQLISIGKNIVENTHGSICPLCKHDYLIHEELVEKIANDSKDILELDSIELTIKNKNEEIEKILYEFNQKAILLKEKIDLDYSNFLLIFEDKKTKFDVLIKNNQDIKEQLIRVDNKLNEEYMQLGKYLVIKEDIDVSYVNVHKAYMLLQKEFTDKKKSNSTQIGVITSSININKTKLEDINLKITTENNLLEILKNTINSLETEPTLVEYRLLTSQINIPLNSSQEDILKRLEKNTNDLSCMGIKKINVDSKIKTFNEQLKDVEYEKTLIELNNMVNDEQSIIALINDIEMQISTLKLKKEITDEELILLLNTIDNDVKNKSKLANSITLLNNTVVEMLPKIDISTIKSEIVDIENNIVKEKKLKSFVNDAKNKYKVFIETTISKHFNTKSINDIYNRIDPHPTHKEVIFTPEFDDGRTKLRVKTIDENGKNHDDPLLYNSSGQISILSLSIFLAKALQTKDDLDTIFLDDPIQYLDAVNILSFIDLLRTIIAQEKRQIVLSTHDKNFYQLLQKKLDSEYYNSKFIELESYGKIKGS